MVTDLGKISCTPRGEWVNSEEYDVLDIVRYSGAAYISLSKPPAGTLPTNITYWMKLVKDGTGATIDTAMSSTSENPVQNKVITEALNRKLSEVPTMSATVKGGAKVGDGLEMAGDVLSVIPEAPWELVIDTTITEGAVININTFPDGSPLNIKSFIVSIKGVEGDRCNWYINDDHHSFIVTFYDVARDGAYCNFFGLNYNGGYPMVLNSTGGKYNNEVRIAGYEYFSTITEHTTLRKIKSDGVISPGTVIKVWVIK